MAPRKMTPGDAVKAVRGDVLQEDFAKILEITPQHLSRIENNHRGVSKRINKILVKLAKGAYSSADFF